VPTVELATALRSANLRVTGLRIAVLGVLARRPHVPAETVLRELRSRNLPVSHQALYDVLSALTSAGLVRRIEPAGRPALYERRTGVDHHHVICRRCGWVENVAYAVGHAPCLEAPETPGYEVDEAEVTWWGICPACSSSSARV
jgi:Fur family transcriptional regulator, stress-responsive regulator